MYDCLDDTDGRLVSCCSIHYQQSSAKKEKSFENWLHKKGACIDSVPAGTFKESGTNVETVIIMIDK